MTDMDAVHERASMLRGSVSRPCGQRKTAHLFCMMLSAGVLLLGVFSLLHVLPGLQFILQAEDAMAEQQLLSAEPALSAANATPVPRLRLQIASDLHLEFYNGAAPPDDIIVPNAPVLALLGDIGSPLSPAYEAFLLRQAQRFEQVLVLTGNHEYYTRHPTEGAKQQIDAKIAAICAKHPRLVFLNRSAITIGGVRVLGCTLWSYVPPHAEAYLESYLNDFRLIYPTPPEDGEVPRPLSAGLYRRWHEDEAAWLANEIGSCEADGVDCVVLTHHTPSFHGTSDPRYGSDPEQSLGNYGFSSNMSDLLRSPSVRAWAYGHTHFNNDQVMHGARVLSNQRGYPSAQHQPSSSRYSSAMVVEI